MSHTCVHTVTLAQGPRQCHFTSSHPCMCTWLFERSLFLVSLYFFFKSFFHLFLIPAMVPDENSMEDPLCNSSFGSMVSLDYVTKDMELADTNELNLATSSDIYFQDILEDTALSPTPTSTTMNSPSFLRSWSIERGNPLR